MRFPVFVIVVGLLFYGLMSVLSLKEGGPAQSHPQTSSGEVVVMDDYVIIDGERIPASDPRAVRAFKMASDDRERALAADRALEKTCTVTVTYQDCNTCPDKTRVEVRPQSYCDESDRVAEEGRREWRAYQRRRSYEDAARWEAYKNRPRVRYPYSHELHPPTPNSSYDVPTGNGTVYHMYNGRVQSITKPTWTYPKR